MGGITYRKSHLRNPLVIEKSCFEKTTYTRVVFFRLVGMRKNPFTDLNAQCRGTVGKLEQSSGMIWDC